MDKLRSLCLSTVVSRIRSCRPPGEISLSVLFSTTRSAPRSTSSRLRLPPPRSDGLGDLSSTLVVVVVSITAGPLDRLRPPLVRDGERRRGPSSTTLVSVTSLTSAGPSPPLLLLGGESLRIFSTTLVSSTNRSLPGLEDLDLDRCLRLGLTSTSSTSLLANTSGPDSSLRRSSLRKSGTLESRSRSRSRTGARRGGDDRRSSRVS
jgi:hypothetical protein